MADGDVKDYAGEKKKPSIALVISVGPKMPKKPEDTSKPDEPMKKAWHALVEHTGTYDIRKIRSAAPPRKPNPVRMRRQTAPEPAPMPEPEPEPEEDPEMKRRAMQAVLEHMNRVRSKRDKFDEETDVVPTSMEEMTGSLKDVDLSHFLKPPEER
jgi:hypothetical protein